MEKLLKICELYHCDLDTLMREEMKTTNLEDCELYEKHMNSFSRFITLGVSLILLAVTLYSLGESFGIREKLLDMGFLSFIIISVSLFIISGMDHSDFTTKHPYIEPFYTQDVLDQFNRRFRISIVIGVALILIGVLFQIWCEGITPPFHTTDDFFTFIFMAFITVAVTNFVYFGMQKSKYDIHSYNREAQLEKYQQERSEIIGKWCGCIMLTATAFYLILGFLRGAWWSAAVIYPIGGILCGIVSILLSSSKPKEM